MKTRLAAALVLLGGLVTLPAGTFGAGPAAAAPAAHTALPLGAFGAGIPPPVHHGTLRVSGVARDGTTVAAAGLGWRAPRLPRGMSLLSFEVAYSWQSLRRGRDALPGRGGQHGRAVRRAPLRRRPRGHGPAP